MAICNLFKKLTKPTGEFLMFSQWVDDLTQNSSYGYNYRAVPSKFITANIDFTKFIQSDTDLNVSIPQYLQNYFENGCALGRSWKDNNFKWDPKYSSNIFWNTLIESGLITLEVEEDGAGYLKELNYIGDINVQSYDNVNGMGYSEIYCHIPNSAKKNKISCTILNSQHTITNPNNVVEGYKEEDFSEDFILNGTNVEGIIYNYGIPFDKICQEELDDTKFDINCIILLYDIYSIDNQGESEIKYENLPLGIYFPGCFIETIMTNHIVKWVSNEAIYNSGTSYGIRICTRFSATALNQTSSEVSIVDSDEYASLSKIISGLNDNLELMKNMSEQYHFQMSGMKESLNAHQNSKTNVPYILDVNGTKYWFVNGKNTGCTVTGELEGMFGSCTDEEIYILLEKLIAEGIVVEVKADLVKESPNDYKKLYFDDRQDPKDFYYTWRVINKYETTNISPSALTLTYPTVDENGDRFVENLMEDEIFYSQYKIIIPAVEKDSEYILTATVNDKDYSYIIKPQFYLPSYFGFIKGNIIEDFIKYTNKYVDIINYQEHEGINLSEITIPTPYIETNFNSTGDYIIFLYPKAYGRLDKIVYTNNEDNIIGDFDLKTVKLNVPLRAGGYEQVEYNLYYTRNYTGSDVQANIRFTNIYNMIDTCLTI